MRQEASNVGQAKGGCGMSIAAVAQRLVEEYLKRKRGRM